ncbi:MAG: RICIN domain-containing protein [Archangium sp.]|nr:RICIN domain-containing protein [Archangium sp.]
MRSLIVLLVSTLSLSASAQSVFIHNRSGGFLDAQTNKLGEVEVRSNAFTGLSSQQWSLDPTGLKSVVTISSRSKTGGVIEVVDPLLRGSGVTLRPLTGSSMQQWRLGSARTPGFVTFENQGSGWFLDANVHTWVTGSVVATWDDTNFEAQRFEVLQPTPQTARPFGFHCPQPAFASYLDYGGSPFIRLTADLFPADDGRGIDALVSFTAERPLGTVLGVGEWRERVFDAPAGQRVAGLMPESRHSEVTAWAPAAGGEAFFCNGGQILEWFATSGPVERFELVGDTGSYDVYIHPDPNDCGCDSQLRSVRFRPLSVVLVAE